MTMSYEKKLSLTPLCINMDQVLPFLRSVSFAVVTQRTTRLEWREDGGVMKYMYSACLGAFGTPGTAAVISANETRIRQEIDVETQHRIDVLMGKAEIGPMEVARYLSKSAEIRDFCLKSVQEVYADANLINKEVAKEYGRSIEFLASIELGSTLFVKGSSQIPGPGWLVGLGYDILQGCIDDWSKANNANGIVMVASNVAREGGKEVAENVAERTVDLLNKQPTEKELKHALTRMRELEIKLARQADRLNQQLQRAERGVASLGVKDSIRSLRNQIPRNIDKLDDAQRGVVKSVGKFAVAKALSWVFLTTDVIEAIGKHDARVTAARQ